jgi:hypothetical protein
VSTLLSRQCDFETEGTKVLKKDGNETTLSKSDIKK